MKPEPKVFTKDNPCTKLDIWNCFTSAQGFKDVPLVVAQSKIGINAPRVMEREGRLIKFNEDNTDYYRLTKEGQAWLTQGITSYLKNHPSHADRLVWPVTVVQKANRSRLHRAR